jgi:hypothetical protein
MLEREDRIVNIFLELILDRGSADELKINLNLLLGLHHLLLPVLERRLGPVVPICPFLELLLRNLALRHRQGAETDIRVLRQRVSGFLLLERVPHHSLEENAVSSLGVEVDLARSPVPEDDRHSLPGAVELKDLEQLVFLLHHPPIERVADFHIVVLIEAEIFEATESSEVQDCQLIGGGRLRVRTDIRLRYRPVSHHRPCPRAPCGIGLESSSSFYLISL